MLRTCAACGRENRIPARHLADTGRCGACKAPLAALAEPVEADSETFADIIGQATVPVLVDFWAPWCGPCRVVAPEVARAARELSGRAVVVKVNTELHPDLAARFRVQGIPHFAVFVGGRQAGTQTGAVGAQRLLALVQSAVATRSAHTQ